MARSGNSNRTPEDFNYCIDNMANISVTRIPHLVTNIRDSGKPIMEDGVGRSQVRVTQKADHPLFGTC